MARWNWLGVIGVAASVACGSTTVNNASSGTTGGGPLSLPAGSPCSANDQCNSQICGLDGNGNCCSAACTAGTSVCGIADCDSSGACVKAFAGTSCDSCSHGTLTPGVCDGNGACETGIANACPGNLICNAAGTGCDTKCSTTSDCGTGSYCNAGTCAPQMATGACSENDACTSGVCGISGSGHCCTAACASTTAPCGATDCDAVGACVFAAQGVSCGSIEQSCSGSTQTNAGVCDGAGNCPAPGTTDCTPFICGASGCLTTCTDATSCGTGDFCDLTRSACCAPLASGGTLTVDALAGSDEMGCCGIGANQPCRTLTHAMQLIDLTEAADVTILATAGDAGAWAPPGEKYPIVLGWGVELNAPGVYFSDPPPGGVGVPGTFVVESYSAKDTVGYVSIVGTPARHVNVGMDNAGIQSLAYAAIQIDPGQKLYIANASVNGNATAMTNAFTVMPGGALELGQDVSGTIAGTVNIGNGMNNQLTDGFDGIFCRTDNVGKGCTVTDTPLMAQNSVIIEGQDSADIVAQDFASITLTSTPIIGIPPPSAAFDVCNGTKPDGTALHYNPSAAVILDGKVSMTLKNAAIHCISGDGIYMEASPHGAPTLDLEGATISNTETALLVAAGTANVWNSTFQFNYNGVIQAAGAFGAAGGSVNLNGGLDGGTDGGTTVICSSYYESVYGQQGLVGVNVLNQSSAPLIATNVTWGTAAPDHFACKANLASCTCSLDAGPCTNTPGADGMDAVTESTGPLVTTGNGVSSLAKRFNCL